jgi:hypothetical protein
MRDDSPLDDDILLRGTLTVVVRRRNGLPSIGRMVTVRGCGFV